MIKIFIGSIKITKLSCKYLIIHNNSLHLTCVFPSPGVWATLVKDNSILIGSRGELYCFTFTCLYFSLTVAPTRGPPSTFSVPSSSGPSKMIHYSTITTLRLPQNLYIFTSFYIIYKTEFYWAKL